MHSPFFDNFPLFRRVPSIDAALSVEFLHQPSFQSVDLCRLRLLQCSSLRSGPVNDAWST